MSFYSQFSAYYERIFPFRQQTYTFLRHYVPEPKARVLDIGCGTGHYAGKFAEDGAYAVGIDLDRDMIAYAQGHYPEAHFFCLDMQQITTLHEQFHLIYSIGNVLAHLPQAKLPEFLHQVYTCLALEGMWIFQMVNWDRIIKTRQGDFPVLEFDKVQFVREYLEITDETVTFHTLLNVKKHTVFDERSPLYPCPNRKLMAFHRNTGLTLRGHYGDYHKTPYAEDTASASIFVFQKS